MTAKLVLGLGGTVDYEIAWDSRVFEELVAAYAIRDAELNISRPIQDERDLVIAVLGFMKVGAGGERFVATSDLLAAFAARFDMRVTLGGTPVRAAAAMGALGVTGTLHLVSIDDDVRRLLPAGCAYICSAREDSTDPHLIVQYSQGAQVRSGDIDIRAPHPNRVILVNDPPNRELLLSDELPAVLSDAAVFLISGFNTMQSADLLDQRLLELKQHMGHLPPDAIVFYEDAGFHFPQLSQRVRDALVASVDVYSLNEDEMQAYLGRPLDLLDPDAMASALDELRTLIPATTLVVHTKYWSLALGERAHDYADGLRGGITMASTRYRYGDHYGEREYREVGHRLPSNPGGAQFAEKLETKMGHTVCCIAGLVVDTPHPTTIGLGDTFVGGFIAALAQN